jgi:hypothetical protein
MYMHLSMHALRCYATGICHPPHRQRPTTDLRWVMTMRSLSTRDVSNHYKRVSTLTRPYVRHRRRMIWRCRLITRPVVERDAVCGDGRGKRLGSTLVHRGHGVGPVVPTLLHIAMRVPRVRVVDPQHLRPNGDSLSLASNRRWMDSASAYAPFPASAMARLPGHTSVVGSRSPNTATIARRTLR